MYTYAKEEEEEEKKKRKEEERSHTYVKDPVVHIRIRWIRESPT